MTTSSETTKSIASAEPVKSLLKELGADLRGTTVAPAKKSHEPLKTEADEKEEKKGR